MENMIMNPPKHKPVVVFNSGAGAVGKTSVVNKCLEFGYPYGVNVVAMPSITRTVYAKLGIDTERAATYLSPEDQHILQDAIYETYFECVTQFVDDHQDRDLIMIDRSPLDHVSYNLHILSQSMTLEQSTFRLERAQLFLAKMCLKASKVVLMYYPFPDYWHTYETESSDGFRYDSGGKNLLWALALEALIARSYPEISYEVQTLSDTSPDDVEVGEFVSLSWPRPQMDVDARARYLLRLVPKK